jgi:hypothetical protein
MPAPSLPFVPCMWCGAETGMRAIDPWTIPAGCRVSLIVSCGKCLRERDHRHLLTWARPDGVEAPEPSARTPNLACVVACPVGNGYEAAACVEGLLVSHTSNRERLVDAFSAGSKAMIQHLIDLEHAERNR